MLNELHDVYIIPSEGCLTRLLSFRLYPVDKSRVNEYGVSYDEKTEKTEKTEKPKGKSHKD